MLLRTIHACVVDPPTRRFVNETKPFEAFRRHFEKHPKPMACRCPHKTTQKELEDLRITTKLIHQPYTKTNMKKNEVESRKKVFGPLITAKCLSSPVFRFQGALVSITATCACVHPHDALLIGFVGSITALAANDWPLSAAPFGLASDRSRLVAMPGAPFVA